MGALSEKTPPVTGVYIIHDEETDKKYIGSSRNVEGRRAKHTSFLNRGVHPNGNLQRLYDLQSNLDIDVIVTENREEAYKLEQKLLDENRGSPLLLNVAKDAKASRTGLPWSQEVRDKIAKSKTGQTLTPEQAYKAGSAWRGKTLPEEMKRKMSESHLGHSVSADCRDKISAANSRKVEIEGVVYNSSRDAARAYGLSPATVVNRLNSNQHQDWKRL